MCTQCQQVNLGRGDDSLRDELREMKKLNFSTKYSRAIHMRHKEMLSEIKNISSFKCDEHYTKRGKSFNYSQGMVVIFFWHYQKTTTTINNFDFNFISQTCFHSPKKKLSSHF